VGGQDRRPQVGEDRDRHQAVGEDQDRRRAVEGLRTQYFGLVLKLIKQQRWKRLSLGRPLDNRRFGQSMMPANCSCVTSSSDIGPYRLPSAG
jgi:hypothetical protein